MNLDRRGVGGETRPVGLEHDLAARRQHARERAQQRDRVDASQVLAQIGTLAKGEIVAYAPTFGVSPTRFKVRRKRTFDSSATPLVGARARPAPQTRTAVDLQALAVRMAETLERHEQQDPERLRARIATLQRQLADARRDNDRQAAERLSIIAQRAGPLGERARAAAATIAELADEISQLDELAAASHKAARQPAAPEKPSPLPKLKPAAGDERVAEASAPATEPSDALRLKSGARRMLWVLLRYGRPLTRSQLASLAVVSKGGTLSEYLSALRTQGLIDEPDGIIALTEAGRAEAQRTLTSQSGPYTPAQVAALHQPKLKAGARRMLDVLMRAPEQGFTRTERAGLAGVSVGGTLSEYLSALRTRGLLEEHHRRVYAGSVLYLADQS